MISEAYCPEASIFLDKFPLLLGCLWPGKTCESNPTLRVVPIFPQGQQSERNASARENHPTREIKARRGGEIASRLPRVSLVLLSLNKNGDYSQSRQMPTPSLENPKFRAFRCSVDTVRKFRQPAYQAFHRDFVLSPFFLSLRPFPPKRFGFKFTTPILSNF